MATQSDCTFTIEDTSRPEDVAVVVNGLDAYNLQYAPAYGFRPLNIFLRSPDQTVVGGLIGLTYWGWLYVDRFWLAEDQRGQDYGTHILAAAEQEAQRRGCRHARGDCTHLQIPPGNG
jgi:GNAT superfamily N-acetyltransferase